MNRWSIPFFRHQFSMLVRLYTYHKKLNKGQIYFGSWFQGFQFMWEERIYWNKVAHLTVIEIYLLAFFFSSFFSHLSPQTMGWCSLYSGEAFTPLLIDHNGVSYALTWEAKPTALRKPEPDFLPCIPCLEITHKPTLSWVFIYLYANSFTQQVWLSDVVLWLSFTLSPSVEETTFLNFASFYSV